MPRTIKTQTPAPPAWVKRAGQEATHAWEVNLSWCCKAATAKYSSIKRLLLREARNIYGSTHPSPDQRLWP